jgi:L-rhamnose mutarotase
MFGPPIPNTGQNPMKRFGQTIQLKPESLEAYTALHAQPWPEVLEALRAAKIRNYSIFRHDLTLFAILEYHGTDWDADQRSMASLPRIAEWSALTASLQEPFEDRATDEWWANMEEVFHLD